MTDADYWKKRIKKHQKQRTATIEIQEDIRKAMTSYLETVGETGTGDFTLTYHEFGEIELKCRGDLFNLEEIGDFCEVFGLSLMINNRVVVEDHLTDSTTITTGYLFTTHPFKGGIE